MRISSGPRAGRALQMPSTTMTKSSTRRPTPLSAESLFELSWTHFIELIRLDDPWKRAFYENECLKGHWSVRQLQRQIGSLLYERTGLSTDKQQVIQRAHRQAVEAPGRMADLIRDPYVLEFAGLTDRPRYHESDLEAALLDRVGPGPDLRQRGPAELVLDVADVLLDARRGGERFLALQGNQVLLVFPVREVQADAPAREQRRAHQRDDESCVLPEQAPAGSHSITFARATPFFPLPIARGRARVGVKLERDAVLTRSPCRHETGGPAKW